MAKLHPNEEDLYAVLKVEKTADVDEIRRSYQKLARQVGQKSNKVTILTD